MDCGDPRDLRGPLTPMEFPGVYEKLGHQLKHFKKIMTVWATNLKIFCAAGENFLDIFCDKCKITGVF